MNLAVLFMLNSDMHTEFFYQAELLKRSIDAHGKPYLKNAPYSAVNL